MDSWNTRELRLLRSLRTPRKIQDFLERIPANFDEGRDTCLSPRKVLRERRAHCIEGAMLAAAALRIHGHEPLLLDLEATNDDHDHVIAPFRERGLWGAISKSNHAVLRYRDPIYRTIRELALSYFHEYTNHAGKKTLRSYSLPVNLSRFDKKGWMTAEEEPWYVAEYLCDIRHLPFLTKAQARTLRLADPIERKAGKLTMWKKNGNGRARRAH